ncbi:hypothetical protein AB0K00_22360 [Dactylosporangium sp. NPDC049525]|uniref:hypothetical protein n=1 Tax=Dactylosporangium sp. NPDC049525 TaxID=3154730 RepID=UPI00343D8258
MSFPASDDAFLHRLERNVRAELTEAETSPPEDALAVPIDEWMFDPADAQREEAGLRSLLGAVEALKDGSRPAELDGDRDA